jgi:hypothetical protein
MARRRGQLPLGTSEQLSRKGEEGSSPPYLMKALLLCFVDSIYVSGFWRLCYLTVVHQQEGFESVRGLCVI